MKWYEAECRNGIVVVRNENGDSVITDSTGTVPQLISPHWQPTRLLRFGPDVSLLFLKQRAGGQSYDSQDRREAKVRDCQVERTTGWLLTGGHRFGAVVDGMDDSVDFANLRKAVVEACTDEVLRLLTTQCDSLLPDQPLGLGEKEVLRRLLTRLDISSALTRKTLAEFVGSGEVTPEKLYFVVRTFESFARGLFDPNMVPVELLQGMAVTQVRHVPLDDSQRESAHLCWTTASACRFFIVFAYRKDPSRSCILVPDCRTIYGGDIYSGKAATFLNTALASLFLTTISSNVRPLSQSYRSPDRGGLLLFDRKNFGHGILDELQAIERALHFRSRWTNLPVFYVHMEGGAALYSPLEHLYPELEDRFVYMDSLQDIVDHAFAHGIQLFSGRKGSRAMRATRDRLIEVARRQGESSVLAARADALKQQRPVVVFGLRMSNRHPVDALGFYVRLAEALLKRFGRLSVIFDGMNVDPNTGKPAAPIFNGFPARDGEHEIDLEADFVCRFRAAVSNLPIEVQSCVGLPIRENLFWLSQADFFVAPNGGGLAKLRWALDIPGYVLTSSINLKYCYLSNIYGDSRWTEEPFTPIYMNGSDDVKDVPLQPPRLKGPKLGAVPYPENFVVAEEKVIPEICELIAMSLQRSA